MAAPRLCLVVCVIFAVVITTESKVVKSKPASDYFNLCRISDPNLSDCVKDNVNSLRDKLIAGIPDLKLVPLDPMRIPVMELEEGEGNFRLRQKYTNMTLYGFGKFQIKSLDLKTDSTGMFAKIEVYVPNFTVTADYELDGQVLVLPMRGKGDCFFNFTDARSVGTFNGTVVKREGKDFMELTSVQWNLQAGGAKFHFNNLFNGDKTLGDATNAFLNENWKEAFDTYKHLSEQAYGSVFREIANQVFMKYPVNELYLN